MGNIRPPQQDDLAKQLANIKGGSTTDMMKQLFNIANQIKDVDPKQVQNYNRMVIMDSAAAGLRMKFGRERSRLIEVSVGIQSNISQLKSELVPGFQQEFRPLQADVQLREEQRQRLQEDVRRFTQSFPTKITEIIQDMLNGKPQSEINSKLEAMEREQKRLLKEADNLDINERALQSKLDNLHEKTYRAVPLSARANVQPPTPSDTYKPE